MTGDEYKLAIGCLGLSQVTAARWLGVAQRTSHGYANGDTAIPEPVAKLIRLVLKLQLDPADVE